MFIDDPCGTGKRSEIPSPLLEKEVPWVEGKQEQRVLSRPGDSSLAWVQVSVFYLSPFLHLPPFRALAVTERTINYNLVQEDAMWSKHPPSIIQLTLTRSYRSTFCSTWCHGIAQEMALSCQPGLCSGFPNGCGSLKGKRGVYGYGESASLLAELSNELGAYFAVHLCQLMLRDWEALQDWKNPKSFNELWKWILTGSKTICGMTERKTIWCNFTHVWTKGILHLSTFIISFITKLKSWFYQLVWLVFGKVFSDYFFFVDLVGFFDLFLKNLKFMNDFHCKVHATSLE